MTTAEFIADQEGFRDRAYRDSAGYWTIGFGRLLSRDKDADFSHLRVDRQEEIVTHFAPGVEERKIGVRRLIDTEITRDHNRLTALTSFAYNFGMGALERSKLRRLVNEAPATDPFAKWSVRVALEWIDWHQETVNGRKQASAGLVDRRRREVALFFGVSLA